MPTKGKESIIRRQKEIARQQKQKEKRAKRAEKSAQPKAPGHNKGDLRPDELGSLEDIIGPTGGDEPDAAEAEGGDGGEGSAPA